MTGFFKQVEGAAAIIVEGGVHKQVEVYTRNGALFAKAAGGFVRLMADGSTSKAGGKMRLDFIAIDDPLARTGLGALCLSDAPGAKALPMQERQKLIGAA